MPVILDPTDYAAWLDSPADALLKPYPAERMEAFAVSDWVNSSRHEGAKCIEPAA
jgi:putative SOS response-associated peptidase YedK